MSQDDEAAGLGGRFYRHRDAEADAKVDALEVKMGELSRQQRWTIVIQTVGIGALVLLDLILIWRGGGQWQARDALMVGGLGGLGLLVCVTRASEWRYSRQRDVREVLLLRSLGKALHREPGPPEGSTDAAIH